MADDSASVENSGMRKVPNVDVLEADRIWQLHLYSGGKYVALMGFIDVNTNYLQLLDMINKSAEGILPKDKAISYTVRYSDRYNWRKFIEINDDWDIMDMLLVYRSDWTICIHVTYDIAPPVKTFIPSNPDETPLLPWKNTPTHTETTPLPAPSAVRTETTPLSAPSAVRTETTPLSAPSAVRTETTPPSAPSAVGTETTPQNTSMPQSSTTPPPHSSSRHNKWVDFRAQAKKALGTPPMTPFTRLLDEATSSDDSPEDSSDEDGVRPPPATTPDEEAVRLRELEEWEYFKDADRVYGMADEEVDWRADGLSDGEDSDNGWDPTHEGYGLGDEEGSDDDGVAFHNEEIHKDEDEMSDYNSEDNMGVSGSDTELEEGCSKMYKNVQGLPPKRNDDGKVVLLVGQVYRDINHFRDIARDYAIENGFELLRCKNETTRVTLKCQVEGCTWRCHASRLKDRMTFKIKTLTTKHTCSRIQHFNKEASAPWMAGKLMNTLRNDINAPSHALVEELQKKYHLENIPPKQVYRAKALAIEAIEGSHKQSYELLPAYREELMRTNPGSTFKIEYDGSTPPKFKRLFMAVAGLKDGFIHGCRPLIGIDGCHLKGTYKGTLLTAVGLDGNNGVYPIAWAVVEQENKATWKFFIQSNNGVYPIAWAVVAAKVKLICSNQCILI